ncbi:peptidase A4 family-domain-containing protein [Xylariales sp. PMI_506]|nr:peptidase A4 family-domain-containing protein [Xylariales sp. PMI_506]
MKFTAAASVLLGAQAALALPGSSQRYANRLARRAARQGKTLQPADGVASTNETHVSYSSNWAGAVQIGTDFTKVTGVFTVPTPKAGTGTAVQHSASAWVGIDGDTCETAILQTGVDFTITEGVVSYDAWYEWYPAVSFDFTGITISAGDVIALAVESYSTTSGIAYIENVTTGKVVYHEFTAARGALCNTNAEWIVEDFEEGSSLVPFADFGTVTFTDALVNGEAGGTGATIIDIRQDLEVLTSCTASGSTVSCTYV